MLQRAALHPRRSTILWTNATAHHTASTHECHFVDKRYSAPHSIHAEVPICGQMLQRTALHPRMSAILWTNAAAHRSASTPDTLCVEESILQALGINFGEHLTIPAHRNVVFIKVFVTFAAKY